MLFYQREFKQTNEGLLIYSQGTAPTENYLPNIINHKLNGSFTVAKKFNLI